MKRIFTMGGNPAVRHLTVADLAVFKGKMKLGQATAPTTEEARSGASPGPEVSVPTPPDARDALRTAVYGAKQ